MKRKVLFLIAALMAAVILLSSCTLGFLNSMTFDIYPNADKYEVGSFSYDKEGIEKIVIDWVGGRVAVYEEAEGGTAQLEISENSATLVTSKRMHHYTENGVIHIKYCESGFTGSFSSDEIKNKELFVVVPVGIELVINAISADVDVYSGYISDGTNKSAETAQPASLNISSVSGDIYIGKTKCDSAKLESVSGAVKVSGEFKTITAKTVSGDISLDKSVSESAKIESVSGKIDAGGNLSSVTAKTVSGSITIGGFFEKADISSTSGKVTIGDFDGTLEFHTTSGKLKSSIPHTEDGKTYVFGNSGATAKVGTVSGDLTVG